MRLSRRVERVVVISTSIMLATCFQRAASFRSIATVQKSHVRTISHLSATAPGGQQGPTSNLQTTASTHGNATKYYGRQQYFATKTATTATINTPSRRRFSTEVTSTHAKADLEWNANVPKSFSIPLERLELSYVRSSGAGGQSVNKVSSQVQVRFHVPSADWIPDEVRERLSEQQAGRMTKQDYFILHVQEHRTQQANKQAAVTKLEEMILAAWTRPKQRQLRRGLTKQTKENRIQEKRKRSVVKQSRRNLDY
jgi:protein subunit release factor B